MELDLPKPVSYPPSLECTRAGMWHTYLQKYVCEYKKLASIGKIHFFRQKKSEKVFCRLTLCKSEFGIFTWLTNSGFGPMTVAQWLSNLKIGGSNPAAGSGTVREKMAVKTFLFSDELTRNDGSTRQPRRFNSS
jgi:hypothetical protein